MTWRALKQFLFRNTTPQQTVMKNTFWLFSSQIVARLIRAGIVIWAARVLGAQEYGAFSWALSLAALFTIFIDFGINALITRESSRDLALQQKYFATGLVIKLITFAIAGVIVLILSPALARQEGIAPLIPLIILIIGFDSFRDFAAALSRAWEKMEIEAMVQVATNVFIAAAGIAALLTMPGSYSFLGAYAIGTALGMILAFYPFRHYLAHIRSSFSKDLIKPIIVSSWPFGILGLMGGLLLNTDSILIGWLRSTQEVGLYAAPQRVAQLIYFLPFPLVSSFFPQLARAVADKVRFRMLLEKASSILILLAVPLTVGGVLLSGHIILLLYGSEYIASETAFVLMNLTYLPVFLSGLLGNALFALNRERKLFVYVLLGIGGNIILDLIFIPLWGIAGAALATLCNQIIISTYLLITLRGEMRFHLIGRIKKIVVACAAMVAIILALSALNVPVYLTIVAAGLAYIGALILMKEEIVTDIRRSLSGSANGS